ncbi:DUF3180 domain-containing protein [Sanguibacter sp. A247]|uniref:DUF3180 domain-containing protein n=1 Tax=unclassified Sanguibacter TaxID=2645534 RepID=UPI003FD725B1
MTSGVRVRWLVVIALAVMALAWGGLSLAEKSGAVVGRVAWPVTVALVLLAGLVLWTGWAVRAYTRGTRPSLSGLRAARTLVLAQSAALTGAALAGWYAGHVLLVVGDLDVAAMRSKALAAGLATLASMIVSGAGLVVERWCRVRGRGDDRHDDGSSSGSASATPA